MVQAGQTRRSWSIWKPLSIGFVAAAALFGLLFVWGTTLKISGAVIAKGQVQVSSVRTVVQHPVGGVVAEVLARNGDKVQSGDIVLKLDETQLRTELAAVEGELFEILANEARLMAELSDQKKLSPHRILREATTENPELTALLERQQRQLDAHYTSLDTQVRLLEEQIRQVHDQTVGEQAVLDSKREHLALAQDELEKSLQSLEKGIITKTVVTTLQRDVIATNGEIGRLIAKIAEMKAKISEQKLKIHLIPYEIKEKSSDSLNLIGQMKKKLLESRRGLLYKLSKLEIRTPVSGIIHDSKVLGLQSVVEAAKPIMYVVPDNEPVSVSVRVDAADVDQVYPGQAASLRFIAFNQRSTPVIEGQVTNISADAFLDERTQKLYYFVEVSLIEPEVERLGEVTLISGMPVEAFFTTRSRSPVSYITKPITDYFNRALRDT
ncbi:HlyD family type I secretion periplasmic adaptor subunit [Mesorhizobium sp. L-8-10]|uniref:HlyD family type I secretion periplasmic adaptor subunit n=1 Tax=unclassified Mesorhizobium TaxID=325217 RepID=UPI001925EB94|nr:MULTISPECIES: HlyD family type I secretion periplasmic adaptor subunit [unclassified Mesorhizobium]BCH23176.1 HlyD family type I secretion periplasmic adaptor subunit [Mesorhizobium sp. L-8-3]BCH30984.1 HlyD family type I secretion periplasmic adaptor subunit [Mesorhizobium sp. L-8-10]